MFSQSKQHKNTHYFFAKDHLRSLAVLFAIVVSFSLTAVAVHGDTLSEQLEWSPKPIRNLQPSTTPNSDLLSGDSYGLELKIAPTNRHLNTASASAQEQLVQQIDVIYHQQLTGAVSISYENSAGFQQTNFLVFGDFNPESNQVAFSSKLGTEWKLRKNLTASAYTYGQHSIASIAETYGDVISSGGNLAYKPFKNSSIAAQAVYQQQYGMDDSIVAQNIYGLTIAQQAPKIPVTLHLGTGYVESANDAAADTENIRGEASLSWKFQPRATFSTGLLTQNSDAPSTANAQNRSSYYTQISFQPVPITTIRMRTAYETFANSQLNSADSGAAVSVSVGVDVKVTKKINTGFSMRYLLPVSSGDSDVFPATAIISFSASGLF